MLTERSYSGREKHFIMVDAPKTSRVDHMISFAKHCNLQLARDLIGGVPNFRKILRTVYKKRDARKLLCILDFLHGFAV